MRTLRRFAFAAVAAVPLVFGAAIAKAADIVDTAASNEQFKTLVAAVQAAGLVDTLKGMAPTRCSRRPTRRLRNCPRHGGRPSEAGEQGPACRRADLPRGAG